MVVYSSWKKGSGSTVPIELISNQLQITEISWRELWISISETDIFPSLSIACMVHVLILY